MFLLSTIGVGQQIYYLRLAMKLFPVESGFHDIFYYEIISTILNMVFSVGGLSATIIFSILCFLDKDKKDYAFGVILLIISFANILCITLTSIVIKLNYKDFSLDGTSIMILVVSIIVLLLAIASLVLVDNPWVEVSFILTAIGFLLLLIMASVIMANNKILIISSSAVYVIIVVKDALTSMCEVVTLISYVLAIITSIFVFATYNSYGKGHSIFPKGKPASGLSVRHNHPVENIDEKLAMLKKCLDEGTITQEDYESKKKEILQNYI